MLDDPQPALAVEVGRLDVAVAPAPDLGPGTRLADVRVVGRDRSVGADAQHLAPVAAELLRLLARGAIRALAHRHVQHAVGAEGQARAEVQVVGVGRHRAQDHLHLLDRAAVGRQPPARHAGAVAALARLGVAPEDRAVVGEARAQRHVEQAALAARVDRRQPAQRLPTACRRRETMRMRPGFSVTSRAPSGSGSTAHGLASPSASTWTLKPVLCGAAQARVCSGKAGRCDGTLAAAVCSGLQVAAACGVWANDGAHARMPARSEGTNSR